MAAVSPPAGGGIDDVFPTWRKSNIWVCPITFPADGGGGGAGMAKQEAAPRRLSSKVDSAGAPAGDTSGVDLVSKTKTSVVSPQHANPKQTDDASTLAKDMLGVSLVPETTVQSVPDATSSPPVDQEVPSVSRSMPFRFSCNPPSDPASMDAFI
jgi:hypothetical protein